MPGQPARLAGTLSRAALPGPSATVFVDPPLSASGLSLGLPIIPGHVASPNTRLWPPLPIAPRPTYAQFPPKPSDATSVFFSVAEPHWPDIPPAPRCQLARPVI